MDTEPLEPAEDAGYASALNIVELEAMTLNELREMAKEQEIAGYSRLKKTTSSSACCVRRRSRWGISSAEGSWR